MQLRSVWIGYSNDEHGQCKHTNTELIRTEARVLICYNSQCSLLNSYANTSIHSFIQLTEQKQTSDDALTFRTAMHRDWTNEPNVFVFVIISNGRKREPKQHMLLECCTPHECTQKKTKEKESETITNNVYVCAYVDFMRRKERWRHSQNECNSHLYERKHEYNLTLCLTHTERTHARLS